MEVHLKVLEGTWEVHLDHCKWNGIPLARNFLAWVAICSLILDWLNNVPDGKCSFDECNYEVEGDGGDLEDP